MELVYQMLMFMSITYVRLIQKESRFSSEAFRRWEVLSKALPCIWHREGEPSATVLDKTFIKKALRIDILFPIIGWQLESRVTASDLRVIWGRPRR